MFPEAAEPSGKLGRGVFTGSARFPFILTDAAQSMS